MINKGHEVYGQDIKDDIRKDIRTMEYCKGCKDYYDIVVHTAAQTSAKYSYSLPNLDADVNILGTINLLRELKCKFIFLSTCAVYGEGKDFKEGDIPHPTSPYAISKLAAELYIKTFAKDWVILRLSNVIGKGKRGEPNVYQIFNKAKKITIFGDGKQTRDFIDVQDVCKAIEKSLTKKGLFNIGSGKSKSILEVAKEFNKPYKFAPARKELRKFGLDISKAKKEGLL